MDILFLVVVRNYKKGKGAYEFTLSNWNNHFSCRALSTFT